MSANSKIEWCDHTFNPWIGCTKVSPGCANCYAEGESRRRGWARWGKGQDRHRTSADYWKQPLKWNATVICGQCGYGELDGSDDCRKCGKPLRVDPVCHRPRVFCASLADWLDPEVPIEWLADLLALIHATPNLDWLLLTKRIEYFEERIKLARPTISFWRHGNEPPNVWLGVSVEDQKRADERIPILLQTPAAVRFLSCEPLLGSIDLRPYLTRFYDDGGPPTVPDWIIVGGESGPKARPCNVEWLRDIVQQCKAASVSVFVKQLGARSYQVVRVTEIPMCLRDRKGGDPSEWPADLRVREFPHSSIDAPASPPAHRLPVADSPVYPHLSHK